MDKEPKQISKDLIKSLKPGPKSYEVVDSLLPGFSIRVEPGGTKTYYCRMRRSDGLRVRMKIGLASVLSPVKARDEARRILADVTLGADPVTVKRIAKEHTLETFLNEVYGPWVEANRKAGTRTLARLKSSFKEYLPKRLSDIKEWDIVKWKTARIKKRNKRATGDRDVACLKAALEFGVRSGYLPENPLKGLKPVKRDKRATIRVLTHVEEIRLWKAFDKRDEDARSARDSYNEWRYERKMVPYPNLREVAFVDHVRPMITLLLNTGLRRGEAFTLAWQDVDFAERTLTIRAENAKSGKQRIVPLNKTSMATLKAWRDQSNDGWLVFPSPITGERLDNIHKVWNSILKVAKLTGLRLHDLRHTFATRALAAGADIAVVMELLGHQDIATTAIYLHPSKEDKRKAVERLTSLPPNVVELNAERA